MFGSNGETMPLFNQVYNTTPDELAQMPDEDIIEAVAQIASAVTAGAMSGEDRARAKVILEEAQNREIQTPEFYTASFGIFGVAGLTDYMLKAAYNYRRYMPLAYQEAVVKEYAARGFVPSVPAESGEKKTPWLAIGAFVGGALLLGYFMRK